MPKEIFEAIVSALDKEGVGETLTTLPWEPEAGDVIAGVLVHREVIKANESEKTYDKITLRTTEGLFDVLLKSGILAMARPKVVEGDTIVVRYDGLKEIGDGKRKMHTQTVRVYHTGKADDIPF